MCIHMTYTYVYTYDIHMCIHMIYTHVYTYDARAYFVNLRTYIYTYDVYTTVSLLPERPTHNRPITAQSGRLGLYYYFLPLLFTTVSLLPERPTHSRPIAAQSGRLVASLPRLLLRVERR